MEDKPVVRDKSGRIIGHRGSGETEGTEVFEARPGGLGAAAAAAKAKASPSPAASPSGSAETDAERQERYRKMREAEAADRPPLGRVAKAVALKRAAAKASPTPR